jgi:hypothetical protein
MSRYLRINRQPLARGFSLLEGAVALTVLGIGLIMIAAIFPVALSQHRDSVDLAHASALASKAEAVLKARLSDTTLWSNSNPAGNSGQWYMLPMMNLASGATAWDNMPALAPPNYTVPSTYANVINGINEGDVIAGKQNPTVLSAMDILSDRLAPFTAGVSSSPFTDFEFGEAGNRTVWTGFYRKLDTLTTYAVGVCKQRRGQLFAEQDLGNAGWVTLDSAAQNPFSTPKPIASSFRRLPMPWRVSVGAVNLGSAQSPRMQLLNTADLAQPRMLGGGVPLGVLAPRGTKILLQGSLRSSGTTPPAMVPEPPTTRVLTVSDVLFDASNSPSFIEVLEDISDVPLHVNGGVTFDIWVFPPAIINAAEFGKESPLLDWRFQ